MRTFFCALFVTLSAAGAYGQPTPVPAQSSDCKCTPGDQCWPSTADFTALNQTVSGHLLPGIPPGSVCYPDSPYSNYNEFQCEYVRDHWFNSTFHATHPVSIGFPQWVDDPCPPTWPNGTSVTGDPEAGANGCEQGGYPVYALEAREVEHVAAVVSFASEKGIRVNVKSTGHSFNGRSAAYGSISIWTHNLRGIEYDPAFQPDSCSTADPQMAFRIAAGERVRDVYEAANAQNAVAVGGSAQDVGIVGWFTGGGHGPLTSTYGMGSDNVLQLTVVAPTGEIVVANECQHADLFWAIRGGGGGTFGAVTEVVMKGYPAPAMQVLSFEIAAADAQNETGLWDAVTYFLSELPRLKEGGISGQLFITGPSPLGSAFYSGSESGGIEGFVFAGRLFAYDKPNGTMEALFEPTEKGLHDFEPSITFESGIDSYPSFFQFWDSNIGDEPVGGAGIALGSRLLPAKALIQNIEHLNQVIQNVSTTTTAMQFHMSAGSTDEGLDSSLNPAWREAVVHAVTGLGYPLDGSFTPEEQQKIYDETTYVVTEQLKSLAPDSGAYFNEADPFDPNWQYDFWGENYPRLREIKERHDPDSVMWCRSCVGGEEWVEQEDGSLCRADWDGKHKGEL